MSYSGLPNGGNSMTSPGSGVSPQAAAFARQRLMQAQQAGVLPQNFQIAHTGKNLIGQFHQLQPGIAHANHGGDPNHSAILDLISGLGQNNLVARGQTPNFGDLRSLLPNGGNSNPQAPGQAPAPGLGDTSGGQSPATALIQMLLGQLSGSAYGAGTPAGGQAPGYYDPNNPTLY